jgi:hypothetical protein
MKVGIKNILTLIVLFAFAVNQNSFLYAASKSKKEAVLNRVLGYGTLASVDAVLWKLAKKKELGTLSDDGDAITAKFIAKKLLKTSLKPKAFVEILKKYPRTSSAVLLLEALCAIGVIDSTRGVVKFVKYRKSEERIDDQISQAEKRFERMEELYEAETETLATEKKKIQEEYDKKIADWQQDVEYVEQLEQVKQFKLSAVEFKEKMGNKQFVAARKEVASLRVKKADYQLKKAEQKKDKTRIAEARLECFEKQLKVISDNKMDPVERVDELVEVIKRKDAYIESLDSDSDGYEGSCSLVNGKIQERIETLIEQPGGSGIIEALLGSSNEALGILHGVVGDMKPFKGKVAYPVGILTFKERLKKLQEKAEGSANYPQLEKLCEEQGFIDGLPLRLGLAVFDVPGNVASLEKAFADSEEDTVSSEEAEVESAAEGVEEGTEPEEVVASPTPREVFKGEMEAALVVLRQKVQGPDLALATAKEAAQITLLYSRLSEEDKATVKSGVNKKIWDKVDSVSHMADAVSQDASVEPAEEGESSVVDSGGVRALTSRIVSLYGREGLGVKTFADATTSAATRLCSGQLDTDKKKTTAKEATAGLASDAIGLKSFYGQLDEKGIKVLPLLDELNRFVAAEDPVGYLNKEGVIGGDNIESFDDVRPVLQRIILAKQKEIGLKEQLRKQLKEKGAANGDDASKGKQPDSAEVPGAPEGAQPGWQDMVKSGITDELLKVPVSWIPGFIRSRTIGSGLFSMTVDSAINVALGQIPEERRQSAKIADVLPNRMHPQIFDFVTSQIRSRVTQQQISSSILGIKPTEVAELKTFAKSIWPVQVYTQLRQLAVTITSPGANKLAPSFKPFSILRTGEKVPAAPSAVPIEDDDLE